LKGDDYDDERTNPGRLAVPNTRSANSGMTPQTPPPEQQCCFCQREQTRELKRKKTKK